MLDPNTVMRWRYGELAYENTPLFETVIADVNRYSTVHVVMRDPELARLRRFTGTVSRGLDSRLVKGARSRSTP